ncbi:capsule biosynthesis protein [Paracoccus sp. (in: a-proteobacteria)]|uniref:capsule biosynthesis protein n=1 Tax=Paracoccus sp. TaxID=267 RepID=UPI0026DED9C2|nr:capsule biosynthesis protein [Paracoccus sp. (in: a-proteobacteria)]MDO5648184.1 capsule biosynthesis protein [Paracoccus sp. (in: a-proteobacteria)]
MTTPPKARRYNLSVGDTVPPAKGHIRVETVRKSPAAHDPAKTPGAPPAAAPAGPASDQAALDAIRDEKLTARQLRIARRMAHLHQINVTTDEEAVLRLRQRGLDPTQRSVVGKMLAQEGARSQSRPATDTPAIVKTAAVPTAPDLPSRDVLTEGRRAAEILQIQRDIARRRRRRLAMLAMRLLFLVFLPTGIAGWYYFKIATPLYATYSQFEIQSAAPSAVGGGGMGGLAGSMMALNVDAVKTQSYLTSREAMLRLNQDMGFRRAFEDPAIDPVRRISPDDSNETVYRLYKNSVKIGYDPTEGVINMEVIAPDPNLSRDFSLALIKYAEEQVDQTTARLREDQMQGATQTYQDAEARVLSAQTRVNELQQRLGVLDPAAESSVVMGQVAQLEGQLTAKRLELGQLLSNPSPVQSRVAAVRGDIVRLEQMVADTRSQLTEGDTVRASLATVTGELRIAESDLRTRQELLASAAAQLENARIEANKQVRYLSLSVPPVPPDAATYPKAFQNTLVAFMVFLGIYLMVSLTASILREQVST